MTTNKITVTVTVEVFSTDCVPAMLVKAANQYAEEYHKGSLTADDGDTVTWDTKSKAIDL